MNKYFKFIILTLFLISLSACIGAPKPATIKNLSINNEQKYSFAHASFTFKDGEIGVGTQNGKSLDMQIVDGINHNLKGLAIFGDELEVSCKVVDYSNFSLVGDSKFTTNVKVFNNQKQQIGEFEVETILYDEIGLKIGIDATTSKIARTIKENFIK